MDADYLILPFLSWLVAGCTKFAVNFLRFGKDATKKIGYGGLPSNHSTIVASMPAYIAFERGMSEPAFGVSLTLAFIVVMDAMDLRRKIGKHAATINNIGEQLKLNQAGAKLRETVGHTPFEVLAGVILGISIGYVVSVVNL